MTDEGTSFSIGEASEITDLPESTIRFYDREFSDYLSIDRDENNQRTFNEENLKDLEYIRFLIKRENLSVEEVADRLERDNSLKERQEDSPVDTEEMTSSSPGSDQDVEELKQVVEDLKNEVKELRFSMNEQQSTLNDLVENQENILKLLDMNLQRYNEIVQDLPD